MRDRCFRARDFTTRWPRSFSELVNRTSEIVRIVLIIVVSKCRASEHQADQFRCHLAIRLCQFGKLDIPVGAVVPFGPGVKLQLFRSIVPEVV